MFSVTDCCICLIKTEEKSLVKLHETREDLSYFVKLKICVPAMDFIEKLNEVLICESCQERVDKMYSFHEMCMRSKETLMEYIDQLQTEKKTNSVNNTLELKKGNIMEIFKDEVTDDLDDFDRYNISIKKEPMEESEVMNDDVFSLEFVNCSHTNDDNETKDKNKVSNTTQKKIQSPNKKNVDNNKKRKKIEDQDDDDDDDKHSYLKRTTIERQDDMGDEMVHNDENIIDEIRNNGADYNINFICETEYNEDSNDHFNSVQVKQEVEEEHHFVPNEIIQPPAIVGRPSQKQDNEVEPTPKILVVVGKDKPSAAQNRSSFTSTLSTPVSRETPMDMSNKSSIQSRFNMKVYTCDTCGKFFAYPSTLKIHQRTHIEEKTFNCEICFKQFTLLNQYKEHQSTHLAGHSYKCKICNSFYYGSNNFNRHLKTHSQAEEKRKEGPFKCEICGNMFMQLQNLNKHRQTHNKWYSTRPTKT